jgi:catechol 2,3-dioxygenase-like lactoylglutathione lyase family enzyme
MPLNALHHVTVKTADLEATRDFYKDILGLEVGFRPDLDFPGYWLYCGDVPVVHLVPQGSAIGGGPSPDTGPFDHFAFLASDFDGIKAKLDKHGIIYREKPHQSPADRSAVLSRQQQRDGRAELSARLTTSLAARQGTDPAARAGSVSLSSSRRSP